MRFNGYYIQKAYRWLKPVSLAIPVSLEVRKGFIAVQALQPSTELDDHVDLDSLLADKFRDADPTGRLLVFVDSAGQKWRERMLNFFKLVVGQNAVFPVNMEKVSVENINGRYCLTIAPSWPWDEDPLRLHFGENTPMIVNLWNGRHS